MVTMNELQRAERKHYLSSREWNDNTNARRVYLEFATALCSGDVQSAEDIVQRAWLLHHKSKARTETGKQVGGALLRAAARLRREKVSQLGWLTSENPRHANAQAGRVLYSGATTQERGYLLQYKLRTLLPELNTRQRVYCRFLARGYSFAAIAKKLAVSRVAVHHVINRIRSILAPIYTDDKSIDPSSERFSIAQQLGALCSRYPQTTTQSLETAGPSIPCGKALAPSSKEWKAYPTLKRTMVWAGEWPMIAYLPQEPATQERTSVWVEALGTCETHVATYVNATRDYPTLAQFNDKQIVKQDIIARLNAQGMTSADTRALRELEDKSKSKRQLASV